MIYRPFGTLKNIDILLLTRHLFLMILKFVLIFTIDSRILKFTMKTNFIILLSIIVIIASCTPKPTITCEDWGTVDSKPVYLYTLTNSNGVSAKITNYGGIIVEFNAPDKGGQIENIVLGLVSLDDYLSERSFFGSIIGRYADIIAEAKFTLDNVEYTLSSGGHGGKKGFDQRVWHSTTSSDKQSATVSLVYLSADGEEGYPGNLTVHVDYVLNNENELHICYTATTDKPTVLNLTNHSFFNLTNCRENVLNHQVRIYADAYTPYAENSNIPTGEIAPVEGTPYDLRQWTVIGDRINDFPHPVFDYCYCVNGTPNHIVLAAELYEPQTGRLLQAYTTEPGVQFFTGGSLDGRNSRNMDAQGQPMGACFEMQHFANSPNQPNFPSTVLRPGETYTQTTIYKVSVK